MSSNPSEMMVGNIQNTRKLVESLQQELPALRQERDELLAALKKSQIETRDAVREREIVRRELTRERDTMHDKWVNADMALSISEAKLMDAQSDIASLRSALLIAQRSAGGGLQYTPPMPPLPATAEMVKGGNISVAAGGKLSSSISGVPVQAGGTISSSAVRSSGQGFPVATSSTGAAEQQQQQSEAQMHLLSLFQTAPLDAEKRSSATSAGGGGKFAAAAAHGAVVAVPFMPSPMLPLPEQEDELAASFYQSGGAAPSSQRGSTNAVTIKSGGGGGGVPFQFSGAAATSSAAAAVAATAGQNRAQTAAFSTSTFSNFQGANGAVSTTASSSQSLSTASSLRSSSSGGRGSGVGAALRTGGSLSSTTGLAPSIHDVEEEEETARNVEVASALQVLLYLDSLHSSLSEEELRVIKNAVPARPDVAIPLWSRQACMTLSARILSLKTALAATEETLAMERANRIEADAAASKAHAADLEYAKIEWTEDINRISSLKVSAEKELRDCEIRIDQLTDELRSEKALRATDKAIAPDGGETRDQLLVRVSLLTSQLDAIRVREEEARDVLTLLWSLRDTKLVAGNAAATPSSSSSASSSASSAAATTSTTTTSTTGGGDFMTMRILASGPPASTVSRVIRDASAKQPWLSALADVRDYIPLEQDGRAMASARRSASASSSISERKDGTEGRGGGGAEASSTSSDASPSSGQEPCFLNVAMLRHRIFIILCNLCAHSEQRAKEQAEILGLAIPSSPSSSSSSAAAASASAATLATVPSSNTIHAILSNSRDLNKPLCFAVESIPESTAAALRTLCPGILEGLNVLAMKRAHAEQQQQQLLHRSSMAGGRASIAASALPSSRAVITEFMWQQTIDSSLGATVRGIALASLALEIGAPIGDLWINLSSYLRPERELSSMNAIAVQERLFVHIARIVWCVPPLVASEKVLLGHAFTLQALSEKCPPAWNILNAFSAFNPCATPGSPANITVLEQDINLTTWKAFFADQAILLPDCAFLHLLVAIKRVTNCPSKWLQQDPPGFSTDAEATTETASGSLFVQVPAPHPNIAAAAVADRPCIIS